MWLSVEKLFSMISLHYSVTEKCGAGNTGCHQQQDLDTSLSPTNLVNDDLIDTEEKLRVSNMSH